MHEWHNEDCKIEYSHTTTDGIRSFWCKTHNQWAYKSPDMIIYEHQPHFSDKFLPRDKKISTFKDGRIIVRNA